jgi:hypothetical protein
VFTDADTGRRLKTVHFGAQGMADFVLLNQEHKADMARRKRSNYIARHSRGHENWEDPMTAGALSRWILWNKPTFAQSVRDFKRHFNLR